MHRTASIIHLNYARSRHLTGKGIGVAILDTGIGRHPDLTGDPGKIRFFLDTTSSIKNAYDDNGHGTHIAGIQWLLTNHHKYNIRIVNLSVGSSRDKHFGENSRLVTEVNRLWDAGMIVLTAAGKHGPSLSSIGAPGNSRKIITVGASDSMFFSHEKDFSGRGPTENCIKKPDIVAPGSQIISCQPQYMSDSSLYHARSGTSMSTPIVSGCIALLLQQNPNLTNLDLKLRLRQTAVDLGYRHDRQGWGLIQLS